MTSSFAAINYGHGSIWGFFIEDAWTDHAGIDVEPYIKSKTLAERTPGILLQAVVTTWNEVCSNP